VPGRRAAAAATTAAGIVIALIGFGFVVRLAVRHWDDVRDGLAGANPAWLIAGVVLGVAGMTTIALAWGPVVSALGGRVSSRQVVRWYFPGELGKYVPGGIWPVVGRAELACRGGVRRGVAYASVGLSLAGLYLAAMAVVAAALPVHLVASNDSSAPLLVALLLPVGVFALHPRSLNAAFDLVRRVAHRDFTVTVPSWRTSLTIVARYVPAWLCIGGATWCLARAFDRNAPFGSVFVAAVASWVVGFILVPVPGGVGVREAAFVAVAGLPAGTGATVALVARLMFVAIDALGAVLAPVLTRPRRSAATKLAAGSPPEAPS
jgi:glycosyltransferase 2 family protein